MSNVHGRMKQLDKKITGGGKMEMRMAYLEDDGTYTICGPKGGRQKRVSRAEADVIMNQDDNCSWFVLDISTKPPGPPASK